MIDDYRLHRNPCCLGYFLEQVSITSLPCSSNGPDVDVQVWLSAFVLCHVPYSLNLAIHECQTGHVCSGVSRDCAVDSPTDCADWSRKTVRVLIIVLWQTYMPTLNRRIWENKILDTLDRRPNKKCDYVLLRSEQVAPCPYFLVNIRFIIVFSLSERRCWFWSNQSLQLSSEMWKGHHERWELLRVVRN